MPSPLYSDLQRKARRREATWQAISWRVIGRLVPETNPAGSVFGLLTIGSLLAAESDHTESFAELAGSTVLALALYWFAHTYADALGRRLESGERLSAGGLWQTLTHDWSIVRGAGVPLLALPIVWLLGGATSTAVLAALWTCVACLVLFELAAGIRTGARGRELLMDASIGAAMGVAIFALRVILK